jgi:hypothetical protein
MVTMVWVIARTPMEAMAFMEEQEAAVHWEYLSTISRILHDNGLTVVLVNGWTERMDAELLRIRLEQCQVTVLYNIDSEDKGELFN